jgi:4'-phosphopantetheinyl transferase
VRWPGWRSLGSIDPLREPAVHVVRFEPARCADALLLPDLVESERARAARFRRDMDRQCFVVGRTAVRRIVGGLLGSAPTALALSENAYGKPQTPHGTVRFNVSHSGEHLLLAITHGREVGVDLERHRGDVDIPGVAATVFSPVEVRQLVALSDERCLGAFFRLWARKEAVIKAEGTGFSLSTRTFTVGFEDPPAVLSSEGPVPRPDRWWLCDLDVGPGYAAALAVEAPALPVLCWDGAGLLAGGRDAEGNR